MFQVKEREKQGENTREKARGYVVDGRIRKKGWVSTGVNWLVWWANVCLLAASEPVNHYGLRKRPRATFTLSSISSRSLLLSPSDHHALSLSLQFVFSFILFLPSRWLLSLSLSRFSYLSLLSFPIYLSFPPPRVRPLHFPQYQVHPVVPCYKHATMLPAAAHPAYLSELSCYAVVTARTI